MSKQASVFLSFVAICTLCFAQPTMAAGPRSAPWTLGCQKFESAKEFVRSAAFYCITQDNQRICHQAAHKAFASCRYVGNYEKLNRQIHAKMLVLIALAGTRPMSDDVKGSY